MVNIGIINTVVDNIAHKSRQHKVAYGGNGGKKGRTNKLLLVRKKVNKNFFQFSPQKQMLFIMPLQKAVGGKLIANKENKTELPFETNNRKYITENLFFQSCRCIKIQNGSSKKFIIKIKKAVDKFRSVW